MEETANTELVRSHVDTIILRTLQEKDSYPYEILREIEDLSSGQYVLKQATLYSCMKRLEKLGYINSYWGTESEGGRRRYYSLTELGKEFLRKDKEEWEFSRTLINRLLSDKEIDLDSVTPPFDASSLRPLTRRGLIKTDSAEDPVAEKAENSDNESKSEKTENSDNELNAESKEETVFVLDSKTVFNPLQATEIKNTEITQKTDNADAAVIKETSEDREVSETSDSDPFYFAKEPVFQHTLAEENQNSSASQTTYQTIASPTSVIAETQVRRYEETEDMKAAADLLQIGKLNLNVGNEVVSEKFYREEKPTRNIDAQASENYRDVLNRIFDAEIEKSKTDRQAERKECAAAVAPSETEPLRGRHLKELQTSLERQGYNLKIYSPKNRSDYYYDKYLYQNKINFATNLLLFVIMAIEFIVVASFNGLLRFQPVTLVISGIAIAVPPVLFLIVYLMNPSKRIRASYNFMQSLVYRAILTLILIAVEIIVCLLTPTFGIGFGDPRMYIPWLFALDIPLYAVVYNLLYRSKKFHLNCPKF